MLKIINIHLSHLSRQQSCLFEKQATSSHDVSTLNGMETIESKEQVLAVKDVERVIKPKLPKKRLLKKTLKKEAANTRLF